jgi:hypothetical protein
MDTESNGCHVSFFVQLWQDQGTRRFWRGRIVEVDGGQSGAFQDAEGLLAFLRKRLRKISGVVLPLRRAGK